MKRPLIAIGLSIALLTAAAAPRPSFAHSDVSVRVNLGWPAAVYYETWRPAPAHVYYEPVYYEPEYRPVVIYREEEWSPYRGPRRGHGHGHHGHVHDRYCRH